MLAHPSSAPHALVSSKKMEWARGIDSFVGKEAKSGVLFREKNGRTGQTVPGRRWSVLFLREKTANGFYGGLMLF